MRSEIEWGSFWNDRFDVEASEGGDGAISLYSTEFADPAAEGAPFVLLGPWPRNPPPEGVSAATSA